MKKLLTVCALIAFTGLGLASANAGGYWVSMGAPGGKQITYVNGTHNQPDYRAPHTVYRGHRYYPQSRRQGYYPFQGVRRHNGYGQRHFYQERHHYHSNHHQHNGRIVNRQTGEWVVVGGKNPTGPAPEGKRLVEGKMGDPGCFRLPSGNMRCPNHWR